MSDDARFDLLIESEVPFPQSPISNIAELIFCELEHRDENSTIILGHDTNSVVPVSLKKLRNIVAELFEKFEQHGIETGTTVLLASLPGNNELPIALMFLGLTAYGVRVLLPMFMEREEIEAWLQQTDCRFVISSASEIRALSHHDKEKEVEGFVEEIAAQKGITKLDIIEDFSIMQSLGSEEQGRYSNRLPVSRNPCDFDTEALIITTSGSSGKSKLVVYTHGGCISTALSWQAAGFFEPEKFGGPGFTPLFAHTMGIRAVLNALWSGFPVCLIIPEWFMEKPETVRFFLKEMSPTHLTGGPALYNMMLELLRVFPDLKQHLQKTIKTVISSGAPYSAQSAKKMTNAFGVVAHNAFGTTENQQTFNTILCDDTDKETLSSMGKPLPGVRAGLKKIEENSEFYQLYLFSPFGHKRILGNETDNKTDDGFYLTGDIVRVDSDGRLYYHGRKDADFFKDGFGVKVPLSSITNYYAELIEKTTHVAWFAIENSPGLAALLFVDRADLPPGIIWRTAVLEEYAQLASKINGRLFTRLEPFEFRHRSLTRLAVINESAPETAKGTVSKSKIDKRYTETIARLVNPLSAGETVAEVDQTGFEPQSFTKYHNPKIGWALTALGIDYSYHRGEKDSLYTVKDNEEHEILDFVGGFGVNLLGHNHPRLKDAMIRFLEGNGVSLSDQASIQRHVGDLAEDLSLMVGRETGADYYVLFGNSGSEAVEIALHHALFEWKKNLEKEYLKKICSIIGVPGRLADDASRFNREAIQNARVSLVTVAGSYHGQSAGARGVLGNQKKREVFSNLLSVNQIVVDDRQPGWQGKLMNALAANTITLKKPMKHDGEWLLSEQQVSTVIAGIIEPIIGEGGIRRIDDNVASILAESDFPLISDEIQCGLGRTGQFLATKGARADYYLFAKALGGNLEKISAILIDRKRYKKDFSDYYVSTFAGGGLAAYVARETLKIIRDDNIPRRAAQAGKKIKEGLDYLIRRYPNVIESVRGEGVMWGIEFKDQSESENFFLRVLNREELDGAFYSAYLLRNHNIRILHTVSAPNTLRIEPSAFIEPAEIERLQAALEDLCHVIEQGSSYELTKILMDDDNFPDNKGKRSSRPQIPMGLEPPAPGAVKVAFIAHFAHIADELRQSHGDLYRASDTGLRILYRRFQFLMDEKPFVTFAKNLFQDRVHFTFISLSLDSAELEKRYRQGKEQSVVEKIQDAVDVAHSHGAEVVSLGGYTSILTGNGLAIREPPGTRVITGNTLTAAAGVESLLRAIKESSLLGDNLHLGIVGAAGNIGSVVALSLAKRREIFNRLTLVVRQTSGICKDSLETLKKVSAAAGIQVSVTSEMERLKDCDVISIATNTNDPLVFPHHLNKDKRVYISDLSVPSAVAKAARDMENVRLLKFSSFVTLPHDKDLVVSSHTPPGTAFCCAAEALVCGLETVSLNLRGHIDLEAVEIMTKLANKYGLFDRIGEIDSFKTGE